MSTTIIILDYNSECYLIIKGIVLNQNMILGLTQGCLLVNSFQVDGVICVFWTDSLVKDVEWRGSLWVVHYSKDVMG